jgi:signal transduction histidine kinase
MYTKFLAHPGHSGPGVLASLGLALLRFPVRSVPSAPVVAPAPANGRDTVRDAALQPSAQPHAPVDACEINQVLRRMVRIARTLVPAGVRIAERYATLEQPGAELPEFHQVVLHLILDAAQALQGCGTIDVASRCVDGDIFISISDTRASRPSGWGLMAPLLGAGAEDQAECQSLGLLMAGDFADEHGGGVSSKRLPGGGNVVTIAFPLVIQALA